MNLHPEWQVRFNYRSTLRETSLSADKHSPFLNLDDEVYNLDKLSDGLKGIHGNKRFSTCDAFIERNGMYALVELKDQPNKNIQNKEIQKKVIESAMVLLVSWKNDATQEDLAKKLRLFVVFHDDAKSVGFEKIRKKAKELADPRDKEPEPLLFGLCKEVQSLFRDYRCRDFQRQILS